MRAKSTSLHLGPEGKYRYDHQDWAEMNAEPHKGSSHYFMLSPKVGGGRYGFTEQTSFEGAFFVETDKGTYYWLRNTVAGGVHATGNFVLNGGQADLLQAQLPGYGTSYWDEGEMARLPRAYELFPYLNPKKCE